MFFRKSSVLGVALVAAGLSAQAADRSDNSIGYRYGTRFAEPFNKEDISKHIQIRRQLLQRRMAAVRQ